MGRTAGAVNEAWWMKPVGDISWMEHAVCTQVDPDLWHPGPGENDKVRKAKRICDNCPVVFDCFEYAMEHPDMGGILGATTSRERQQMRRYQQEHRRAT